MKDNTVREFQMAIQMAGVDLHPAIVETVLLVHDEYRKKGGKFSLMDACKITGEIQGKYPNGQFYQSIKIGENFKL